jgi:DNA (cytosine-5)-methyltransferase 1
MRMLQATEIRRAMSFPENDLFPEAPRRDRIRLLGNAVCSLVTEAIVRSLMGERATRETASPRGGAHASRSGARPLQGVPVAA